MTTSAPAAPPVTPPPTPPTTAPASAPGPGSRGGRRTGCWVAAVLVVIVAVAATAGLTWLVMRGGRLSSAPARSTPGAFDSAMRKAGVSAHEPPSPVALTAVTPTGSHSIDATFTGDELAALMNSFTYQATVQGMALSLSWVKISVGDGATLSLSGQVKTSDNAYSGTVSAPVAFTGGKVVLTGTPSVNAEGLPIGGAQAQQATAAVLEYANDYIGATPGLRIESAEVTPAGVHVKGTAPNSISY